ncbi:MAG: DUF5131 family protein [Nitratireductor sp.]
MEAADWRIYQVLTKRCSSLMRNYMRRRYDGKRVPTHIWLGVSVEDAAHKGRIEHLRPDPTRMRFISFEPLLGPIGEVDMTGVAWAIVGGERTWRASNGESAVGYRIAYRLRAIRRGDTSSNSGAVRVETGGRLLEGEERNGFPWQIVPKAIIAELA